MAHEVKCSYPSCLRTFAVRKGDDIPGFWYCAVHHYLDTGEDPSISLKRDLGLEKSAKEQVCDHVHNIQGLFRAISDSASNDCQNFSAEAFLSGKVDIEASLNIIRAFCAGIEQDVELLKAKYT